MPNGAEFAQFVAINLPRRQSWCNFTMQNCAFEWKTHTHSNIGVHICVAYFSSLTSLCLARPKIISTTLQELYKVGKQINKVLLDRNENGIEACTDAWKYLYSPLNSGRMIYN